ncbi:MAG: 16S rRNA (cytosine(967)-C(5))-methyltransferase RsmB [Succinivibrio sp.]
MADLNTENLGRGPKLTLKKTVSPKKDMAEKKGKSDRNRNSPRKFSTAKGGSKPSTAGSMSRAAAAMCVNAIEEGRSLTEVLPFYTKDLDDRDRALVSEIVYGTLRHRRLLSLTVNNMVDRSINKRFNAARTLIICALYQILFTRAPAHAIVAATVGACSLCNCKQLTGLVNAILRRFLREGGHLLHSSDPSIEQSFPAWLYETLVKDYGEEKALEIMKNSNEHPPMYLRVVQNKISTDEYLEVLSKHDIGAEKVADSDAAIKLYEAMPVDRLPYFAQGYVTVQDYSAQLAAPLLDLKDGLNVLDTCAAPGGKSAHILDLSDVDLTCLDVDEKRLKSIQDSFKRLGLNADIRQCDVSATPNPIESEYDRILVDAPCSGTGVIRRHPDIKWLRRKTDIEKLAATSASILDNAFERLKKGGILVFTTCSILKQENDDQVKAFLTRHPDARLKSFIMQGKEVETYQRLPGEMDADGFFYARFEKV